MAFFRDEDDDTLSEFEQLEQLGHGFQVYRVETLEVPYAGLPEVFAEIAELRSPPRRRARRSR